MTQVIYIIEDESAVTDLIARTLHECGYETRVFRMMRDFNHAFRVRKPDLCLLDLNLPDGDGLSLFSSVLRDSSVPVIVISGRNSLTDRVVGLEMGADDYLAKPFDPSELRARVRSVLRRAGRMDEHGNPAGLAHFSGVTVDLGACVLTDRNNRVFNLSVAETALLKAFLRSPGRVLSREQLLNATNESGAFPMDRSIDARISRLRRKLKTLTDDETIRTIYGAGYVFSAIVDWI